MVTTRPPKTIVKPTALGPVANTDTKLLIYGLFQKGRVLAQDGVLSSFVFLDTTPLTRSQNTDSKLLIYGLFQRAEFWHRTGSRLFHARPVARRYWYQRHPLASAGCLHAQPLDQFDLG